MDSANVQRVNVKGQYIVCPYKMQKVTRGEYKTARTWFLWDTTSVKEDIEIYTFFIQSLLYFVN